MKSKCCFVFVVGFLALTLVLSVLPVSANLQAYGVLLMKNVTPGESFEHKITLTNMNNTTENAEIGIFGLGQSLDSSTISLNPDKDTSPYSARKFLTISNTTVELKSNLSKVITVKVDVPSDLEDGTKYALISAYLKRKSNANIGATVGIDIPILLTKSQSHQLIKEGKITELNVTWPQVSLIFKNTGNTHYKVFFVADLMDSNGNILGTVSTTPSINSIIPTFEIQRTMSFNQENKLPSGKYSLNVSAKQENGNVLDSEERPIEI